MPNIIKFGLKPTAHDVQSETAAADVVDRDGLLGGDDGVNGRHVGGGENSGPAGQGAQPRRPRVSLKIDTVEIAGAPESLPAGDRNHRLESDAVRFGCEPKLIRPVNL
jgi:hypothetical protein